MRVLDCRFNGCNRVVDVAQRNPLLTPGRQGQHPIFDPLQDVRHGVPVASTVNGAGAQNDGVGANAVNHPLGLHQRPLQFRGVPSCRHQRGLLVRAVQIHLRVINKSAGKVDEVSVGERVKHIAGARHIHGVSVTRSHPVVHATGSVDDRLGGVRAFFNDLGRGVTNIPIKVPYAGTLASVRQSNVSSQRLSEVRACAAQANNLVSAFC